MFKKLSLMKNLFLLLLMPCIGLSQVGINTTDPQAQLHIRSSNQATPAPTDGILIPKIDAFPVINPSIDQDAMLVYLTTTVGNNLPGFYYWSGNLNEWQLLTGKAGWSLTGDAATDPTEHFIGTTDDVPLNFRINDIPSGKIEREIGGSYLGFESGLLNTEGLYNTAIGYRSLKNNTANFNTAVGGGSLRENTTGTRNVGVGYQALINNLTGTNNTALGVLSLMSNTSGYGNTAIGDSCLALNTTGVRNVGVGLSSLQNNTEGWENVGIGWAALYTNSTGSYNVGIGSLCLNSNTTGYRNVGMGYGSLNYNSTGFNNVGIGTYSLLANTTGSNNTALGDSSLYNNSTGVRNVGVGFSALERNTYGFNNTALGSFALHLNTSAYYNVGLGAYSLYNNSTGIGNVATGHSALSNILAGNYNTAMGNFAATNIFSSVNNVTCIGYNAGYATTINNHVNIGNGSVTWIGGQTNWGTYSDARTKDHVQEDVKGLAFITKLRPVTYNFSYDKEYELLNKGMKDTSAIWEGKYDIEKIRFSGFIAQEAEAAAQASGYAFSGIVPPPNGEGAYTLRYAEFVVPLVKAVQEQQTQIEELKTLVKELMAIITKED